MLVLVGWHRIMMASAFLRDIGKAIVVAASMITIGIATTDAATLIGAVIATATEDSQFGSAPWKFGAVGRDCSIFSIGLFVVGLLVSVLTISILPLM